MRSFLLPGLLLSLITAAILLDGCSKSSPDYTSIAGIWRLSNTSGGFAGLIKKYPPASAPVLDLRSDSTYRRTSGFILLESGTYSLSIITSSYGKDTMISFRGGGLTTRKSLHSTQRSMTLGDAWVEGFADFYVRP